MLSPLQTQAQKAQSLCQPWKAIVPTPTSQENHVEVEEGSTIRLLAQIDMHGLIKLAGLAPVKKAVVGFSEWL